VVQIAPRGATRFSEPAIDLYGGRAFVSLGKAWIPGWRCRCGHEWLTKGERPTRCPKCKARTWDRGETG